MTADRLGAQFHKLWGASALSNLGDGVTVTAGPLLAASLTRDPLVVAGVAFAQRLPWLLFSLVSGVLVDRLDRRRAVATVNALRALTIALLALAVLLDAASIPLLYVAFFLLGTGETVADLASVSLVPAVVSGTRLERANSRIVGIQIVAHELVAPPIGGFLFAASAALPFVLDAGAYVAATVLLLAMRGPFRAEAPDGLAGARSMRREIAEGVRWLWRNRLLRVLALAIGVMNVTLMATQSVLVLVAQERLGLGSVGYGLLFTGVGVGGIAGSLLGERIVARLGPGTTLRVGLVVEASTHLVIAVSRDVVVVAAILTLFGLHAVVWSVVTVSLRQRLVPAGLLGRVNSGYMLLNAGGMAVGAAVGGILARSFGLTAPFWFAFVGVAGLTVAIWPRLTDAEVRAATGGQPSPTPGRLGEGGSLAAVAPRQRRRPHPGGDG